jgi:hypothetical protein
MGDLLVAKACKYKKQWFVVFGVEKYILLSG